MVVLSLFDGMGCLGVALKELGYDFVYYTSEIDKHACKVSKLNFPDSIQLGDVTKWREWDIDWSKVDLIGGGSPCQGFSFSGKQLAFDDPRSVLFFEFVNIYQHCKKHNPDVKYLLENVKMKKEHELVISKHMGVHPIFINSALVSAQSRPRLYWTNIYNKPINFFGDMGCFIPQPKDKGILLRDILQTDVPEKYYLSEKAVNGIVKHKENQEDKGFGFGAVIRGGDEKMNSLKIGGYGVDDLVYDTNESFVKIDKQGNVKPNQEKANCFTAGGNSGGNHSDMDLIACVSMVGRRIDENGIRRDNDKSIESKQRIEIKSDGKTGCLTSVQKDNMVLHIPESTSKGFVEINPGECFDLENPKSRTRRGRKMGKKSNCLMAKKTDFMQYTASGRIRRLTPLEASRLQTIPEWYKWGNCSDTQQYRMLGNGWTVDVIKHILSYYGK